MNTSFKWNGSSVEGSRSSAVVKYSGPTNSRGSRWLATIKTIDHGKTWRGSATFEEGPITAALKAASSAGVAWECMTCNSIDPDTYCVGF